MTRTKRQQEIANERREAAGLPVLYCPNCGMAAAHYVPDSLDGYGLITPGFYVCGSHCHEPKSTGNQEGTQP